jgi:hypothetical protein
VAVKLELNLGIEGAPSVTDPGLTYAVLAELLERAEQRGVKLRFSVGDSNGIENAPIGRTSMAVLRETGNYHMALKAALEYAAARGGARASAALEKLEALERATPPVFLGSSQDRVTSAEERAAVEEAAAEWVTCVDYDEAGYREIEPAFGPLAQAIWGTSRFQVAEPWVSADYRVHVTRGVSTHVFAGWTGALKGLVGLHALGGRPADRGMQELGLSPLDVLGPVMRAGSFTGLFAARAGVRDFDRLAANCGDGRCLNLISQANRSWGALSRFAEGRAIWKEGVEKLEAELRRAEAAGEMATAVMLAMRRGTTALLARCEQASPGFRASMEQGVVDGTKAFLLTAWRVRDLIPATMRDERMGMRIGLLSRLPHQADLVVEGLPKIGIGGGPDAYFEVRDVGVVVAGADEITVDLVALREAGVEGNPWAYNHPIHGALQFGRGPMSWDEIRVL